MSGITFVGERAPVRVMRGGKFLGTLEQLSRAPGWTLVDVTRAHYAAGPTLQKAKAFAERHFKE